MSTGGASSTPMSEAFEPVEEQPSPSFFRRTRKFLLWGIIGILIIAVLEFAGIDVTGWIRRVIDNIRNVPPEFILAAVVFKTGESALTSVAWMNVLRAIYPDKQIPFKLAFGAYQGGIGINAIAPAKAGTFTMLGLFRLYIPGSKLATLFSALAVQSIAYGIFSALNYIVLLVARPEAVEGETDFLGDIGGYISARPDLFIIIVIGGVILIALAVRAYWVKIKGLKDQLADGGAILRTPWRYVTHVFAPALGSYVCRWVYTGIFMAAFDIPVTIYTIFLVIAGHSLAGAIAVTPGGLGTTQAIDSVVLRNYTSASNATAYSLAQDAIITAWNVVLAVIAMSWAFGWTETKQLVRDRKQVSTRMKEERAEEAAGDGAEPTAPIAPAADPTSNSNE